MVFFASWVLCVRHGRYGTRVLRLFGQPNLLGSFFCPKGAEGDSPGQSGATPWDSCNKTSAYPEGVEPKIQETESLLFCRIVRAYNRIMSGLLCVLASLRETLFLITSTPPADC